MPFELTPENIELLERLLLAAVLGGLVGLERDIHGRAAGLRTHLLVGLGSCLFMILSKLVAGDAADPGRIAAQVVTGIGFLGAGAIMKEGFSVRGLTTAACFWVVAAIGMACGAGLYFLALVTAFIALISLSMLSRCDKFYMRDSYRTLTVTIPLSIDMSVIIDILKRKHLSLIFVDFTQDYSTGLRTIKFSLRIYHRGTTDKISQDLLHSLEQAEIGMKSAEWSHGEL